MKALKIVFITAIVLSAIIFVVSLFLPSTAHVERKAVIHAPASTVFGLVSDLHTWSQWDPWSREDKDIKTTFEGPQAGNGSVRKWESTKVGNGSMTITGSVLNESVDYSLDFGGKGRAKSEMVLNNVADGTEVTWSMDVDLGTNPIFRFMGLRMDKIVGPDYETGLHNLDSLAQTIKVVVPAPATDTTASDSTATKAE